MIRAILLLLLTPALAFAIEKETACNDGQDNDGDTVMDCADADCAEAANCKPDGEAENSEARCGDWIDNDEDGAVDCDDSDCEIGKFKVCQGSWQGPLGGVGVIGGAGGGVAAPTGGEDVDGERNDYVCSDGIDNDGDGAIDCNDLGCRTDDSVTVCRGVPGLRFSVVSMVAAERDLEADVSDFRFARLQLRTFGPIPQIQDSFFLISMLAERTPRLVFALFQIPIAGSQHRIALNSGAAGLSQVQAISIHKQLFIERPGLFSAMEQFNSAAVELTGPLTDNGKLNYRLFAAGGSGRFDGNVGGRSLVEDGSNTPWGAGAQLGINAVGFYSRFDTPFLYTPVPLTIGFLLGAKYDEREDERYASVNAFGIVRANRVIIQLENYFKREFEFGSNTNSMVAQLGFLAISKHLMLAAEYGRVDAGEFDDPPDRLVGSLRSQRDETQIRGAAHWFFFRNVGVLSAVYQQSTRPEQAGQAEQKEREIRLVGQYRF